MEVNDKLVEEIKSRVSMAVDAVRSTLNEYPFTDQEKLLAETLGELDDFYDFEIKLSDINGKLEIFDSNQESFGEINTPFCRISYPIYFHFNSTVLFEIIKEASPSDMEITVDHILFYVPLQGQDVDKVDFKNAVLSVRRFIENTAILKKDLQAIVKETKNVLKKQIEGLFAARLER
ncbi:hypothetical protein [Sphingobacterium sp. LRF_L2]|uniref:hypothetical protein n=1 Tax=Sphingobacterium sp. LRF_L2 TaxID=3369421 RepID=UPI003F5FCE19